METALRADIDKRLTELRSQLADGRAELIEIEARASYLREATTRITGAIQVLEELVSQSNEGPNQHTLGASG